MKKKFVYLSLIVLSGIILIYSCSTNTAVKPVASVPAATVAIQNFAFVPDTVRIKAGSSVTWTNKDSAPHTATSLTSVFDSGSLSTNGTFNFVFSNAGTYSYHCLIHSMMKTAVVVVTN
ncbi:cupredoxin domain-containing protein [Mucilaginibacter sp.]|uniref:cupredoxin domain-containing protein n=1 Tax=Mucilaginibacter sp. TaxID=1882438 RepID=UPI003D0B5B4C